MRWLQQKGSHSVRAVIFTFVAALIVSVWLLYMLAYGWGHSVLLGTKAIVEGTKAVVLGNEGTKDERKGVDKRRGGLEMDLCVRLCRDAAAKASVHHKGHKDDNPIDWRAYNVKKETALMIEERGA